MSNLNLIKDNYLVCVEEKNEYFKVMNILEELGLRWSSGDKPTDEGLYEEYFEDIFIQEHYETYTDDVFTICVNTPFRDDEEATITYECEDYYEINEGEYDAVLLPEEFYEIYNKYREKNKKEVGFEF